MLRWILIYFVISILCFSSSADEGMWMPHQMKRLDLEKEGLKMDPGDLYKKNGTGIMSSVVHLISGTGSFVSNKGLILTNHHVAFDAIQKASDRKNDYIRKGFLAKNRMEEIPAIGYIADVLLGYEEVTEYFKKVLSGVNDPETRYKLTEKLEKKLISEKEAEAEDRRCVVKSMYSGNRYYLFRFKRLRDIRLVYAPPIAIGNFGGNIDNWMWPRHTGDFTYLRAYVSKDNKGIEYNKNNVPYKPKSYLKTSVNGLKKGDFTFVMGYPGRTYRNIAVSELIADMDIMEDVIEFRKEMVRFLEKTWKGNREVQIRYASFHKGLNNVLKNYTGKLEGFRSNEIVDLKKSGESKLVSWCKQNIGVNNIEKNIDQINANTEILSILENKSHVLRMLVGRYGNAMLSNAYIIYRTVSEKQKADIDRESGYQKRDYPRVKVGLEHAEKSYHFDTDKKILKFILALIKRKNKDIWPETLRTTFLEKGINDFAEGLYRNTKIYKKETRLKMFDMDLNALLATGDAFILLASELEKEMKTIKDRQKIIRQRQKDLKKLYIDALMRFKKGRLAPDANSSIRFTYGNVEGYHPKDGVYYEPFTTLKGVMEKETGKDPFIVPEKLKKLWKDRKFGPYVDKNKNDLVTCFLDTTNVTGGNSGSPVLNSKGEQVGIVFDMTYESLTGDYCVIPELQRTIHVDIRYVLFVTEFVAGADYLIKEMGHPVSMVH